MKRITNGLEEIALVTVSDEVGKDFGIGLGVKMVTFAFEA
jgi:hypothetical protein